MTQEQETLKINVLKLYHSGVKAADIVKHTAAYLVVLSTIGSSLMSQRR